MTPELYVGLMSGTSLDGVDAVLADLDGHKPRLIAAAHVPFEAALKRELLALNSPGENEIERAALAGNALVKIFAAAVADVLAKSRTPPSDVRAIGCHGQTVRHRPERGYTSQIGNAALLAELTGIRVVADFRSRDVAAGGQGAPLAPAFHAAVVADAAEVRVAINLGGIANLTFLPRSGEVIGFDSGPGNCLLDLWASRHLGTPYDAGGGWAAGARAIPELLARMLQEPYFEAVPPKSTGRDLFHLAWLDAHLARHAPAATPVDVQATLAALTIDSVAHDLQRHASATTLLLVCGGGAHNTHLMQGLARRLPALRVTTTASLGLPVDQVEGAAFAWLAQRFIERQPGNLASVTGARGPRLLGALYPA